MNYDIGKMLESAALAKSLSDIIDEAYEVMGCSIVLSDSLHHIVAMSDDLRQSSGDGATWENLVSLGYVPPAEARQWDKPPVVGSRGQSVNRVCLLHSTFLPTSGRYCAMCDIRSGDSVVLKLALSSKFPFGNDHKDFISALSNALYLAYFRLCSTSPCAADDKGRLLLSILKGENDSEMQLPYSGLDEFSLTGTFLVAVLSPSGKDSPQWSFGSVASGLIRRIDCGYLSVLQGNELILLLSAGESKESLSRLDGCLEENRLILGISRPFADICQAGAHLKQARDALSAASLFSGFSGVAGYDEFQPYLMFDVIRKSPMGGDLLNPDVAILEKSDEEGTDHLRTLFCWLQCSRRAVEAAEALYIHRNTLDNRIGRINELISPRWDSVAYRYSMFYSLYATLLAKGRLEYFKFDHS